MEKVLHAQMPFTTGGQTINDRLTAAYHSLSGSQLAKTVCKATTEEPMGPKKKHLDYLLHCTHEPNVSIPQLANLLVERTTNTNWCVVFKSMITIHNLMCYGNERFSQYLASSNANFNLSSYLDKTSVQGYDMSTHVRRYAKYISEKVYTYRMMAFDFCKVKRGREDGLLRTMPSEKLLKTLPLLQGQVDALLEFQVQAQELTNGVINSCFILLFRDLIRLFACYNDGIINLLEKYFDMNKKQCREAFDLYKTFLTRMDKVAEFLKVAESVGIDRSEIPDLAKAPSSLMDALEQHLNSMEGGKTSGGGSRVTSPATVSATRSAIENLSTFHEPGYVDTSQMDEATKRRLLEEEQERLNTLKEQRLREIEFSQGKLDGSGNQQPKTNPFLPSPSSSSAAAAAANQSRASDDLLSLDFMSPTSQQPAAAATNPFATMGGSNNYFAGAPPPQQTSPQPPFGAGAGAWGSSAAAAAAAPSPFHGGTNGHHHQQYPPQISASNGVSATAGGFASDDTFAKAFGGGAAPQPQSAGLDPFGDMLTPVSSGGGAQPGTGMGMGMMGGQQPVAVGGPGAVGGMQPKKTDGKIVKGDLDSSLASLAQNLNIGKGQEALKSKPVQWGGPTKGQQSMTTVGGVGVGVGGAPMAAPAVWGAVPAGGGGGGVPPGAWGAAVPAVYPPQAAAAPGVWGAQPAVVPGMAPMGAYGAPPRPMYGAPPSAVMGMGGMGSAAAGGGIYGGQQAQPQRSANPQDPFGAL